MLYVSFCSSVEGEGGPQLGPYRGWEGKGVGQVARGGVNAQHHGGMQMWETKMQGSCQAACTVGATWHLSGSTAGLSSGTHI